MSLLKANLNSLEKRFAPLARKLKKTPAACIEPLQTRNGEVTALYRGAALHSRYSPQKEAERLIQKEVLQNGFAAVFGGFGLGYHIEAFLKSRSEGIAVVMEPDIPLLRAALEVRDLTNILSDRRLLLFAGDNIEAAILPLENIGGRAACYLQLQSVFPFHEEFYSQLKLRVLQFLNRRKVNNSTLNRFSELWVRNLCDNAPIIADALDIAETHPFIAGKPVAIIGGGPSLTDYLSSLKEIAKRRIIFCVDTALPLLFHTGVCPDFVVSVDPQYANFRNLDSASTRGINLIAEPAAYPALLRMEWKSIFMFHSSFPVGEAFERVLGNRTELDTGGSVATAAWELARGQGSRDILLIGVDLSYPDARSHSPGVRAVKAPLEKGSRIQTPEDSNKRITRSAGKVKVVSYNGGATLTDQRLLIYLKWLEERIALSPETTVSTLSLPKTAKIRGVKRLSLTEVLDAPPIIRNSSTPTMKVHPENRQKLYRKLTSLTEEMHRIEKKALEGEVLLTQFFHQGKPGEDLTKLEEELGNSEAGKIASFLFIPLINEIISNPQRSDKSSRNEEMTRKLYISFAESAQFHQSLFKRSLRLLTESV